MSEVPHQRASPSRLPSTMADAEMATSATEQPHAAMHSTLAVQPEVYANMLANPAAAMKWEIHVEFNNGMWWVMPHELSDNILQQWINGAQQVSFIWDWQDTRVGSFQPEGVVTTINRYIIDFNTMQQRNIDNERTRRIKIVRVLR